ncbi:PREDICTED: uncharacterized protein LOC104596380 isoform X2 [Nelumbo nucifera]|uniref:Uncharacterized protein LOC104596380 isoform X2 n=1 Tax=Nelumbo nucifera TaxID=4432 RepID=A0A1U7ZNV2_NELNU|nr:PREDICTED: uncharacterized protein LOC104596380 isoform X2 [Nelumbo nucifera]
MPTAAGPAPPSDRIPMASVLPMQTQMPTETFARDAIIAWFRGEFAAANAIIDALCNHLTQMDALFGNGTADYESVFAAIHRRRLNWIPILHMQKYYSIADVALELRKVAASKVNKREGEEMMKSEQVRVSSKEDKESCREVKDKVEEVKIDSLEELKQSDGEGSDEVVVEEESSKDDSSNLLKVVEGGGCQEEQLPLENIRICSNHEDCETRRARIKTTKGFIAKEPVKGHMVNVVKGLKLYEDIFTDSELSKLDDFLNELRTAGRNGELSGETFILFNKQLKGNKRELIQLGVPIFGQIKDEATSKVHKCDIEPIPSVLQAVIDNLVHWRLIPESRKPNSCIINFFDEGEYSQPYLKPPHLDQPISTLLLSESTMAFGRVLVNHNGNFKGSLMLSLKEGSLLVMRGNSAEMARHVICPCSNKRVSITFFKVRLDSTTTTSPMQQPTTIPPLTKAMTLWQPGVPPPYTTTEGLDMVPKWGVVRGPLVTVAPMRPMVMSPRRIARGGSGTGVFLPWTVSSKKSTKHLPPRVQRGRLLALPSPIETQVQVVNPTSDPGVTA